MTMIIFRLLFGLARMPSEGLRQAVRSLALKNLPLMPGRYLLDRWLDDFALEGKSFDMVAEACWFKVSPADLLGYGRLPPSSEGPVFLTGQWSLQPDINHDPCDLKSIA